MSGYQKVCFFSGASMPARRILCWRLSAVSSVSVPPSATLTTFPALQHDPRPHTSVLGTPTPPAISGFASVAELQHMLLASWAEGRTSPILSMCEDISASPKAHERQCFVISQPSVVLNDTYAITQSSMRHKYQLATERYGCHGNAMR